MSFKSLKELLFHSPEVCFFEYTILILFYLAEYFSLNCIDIFIISFNGYPVVRSWVFWSKLLIRLGDFSLHLNSFVAFFSEPTSTPDGLRLHIYKESNVWFYKTLIGAFAPVDIEPLILNKFKFLYFCCRINHSRVGISITDYCHSRLEIWNNLLSHLPSVCWKYQVDWLVTYFVLTVSEVFIDQLASCAFPI